MDTQQLKQKILDLAIRGQLIPQNSNDEPASVLLEKIRAEKQTLIEQKKIKKDKKSSYITCEKSPYRKNDKLSMINDKLERICIEHFSDGTTKDITQEIPFEIPENWAWCRLGEVTQINPKNNVDDELEVSFIPMTLISDGFYNIHSSEIRLWKEIKKGFTHFQENDIAIAKITPCFENRKSVVFSNLKNEIGAGTTELHILRPILYNEMNKYIYWFVNTESFIQRGISNFTRAVGQQRVGKDIIENTIIPLPPLAEQQRIVAKVEELLALVEDLETNKTDLKSYIQQTKAKVLDMAIRGELVPQNLNDEPASVLLERIKNEQKSAKTKGKKTTHNTHYDNDKLSMVNVELSMVNDELSMVNDKLSMVNDELSMVNDKLLMVNDKLSMINEEVPFEIPENWAWCKLGEIFEVKSSKRVLQSDWKQEGIPFYRAREIVKLSENNIVNNDLFISEELYEKLKNTYGVPQKGDILVSAVGTIGKPYVVKKEDLFYYKDASVLCFQNIHSVNSNYISSIIKSEFIQTQMYENSKGTTVDTITIEKAKGYILPLPPLPEQKRIVQKIEEIFTELNAIEEKLT